MDDESSLDLTSLAPGDVDSSPAQPLPSSKPRARRYFGMTPVQLAVIGALALALMCIVVGFAYYYFFVLS